MLRVGVFMLLRIKVQDSLPSCNGSSLGPPSCVRNLGVPPPVTTMIIRYKNNQ